MAVKIRLKRMGSTHKAFYRLVAAESTYQRDGRFLEILGYYDPIKSPEEIVIKEELVAKWIKNGAQLSEAARGLLKKHGILGKVKDMAKGNAAPTQVETPSAPPEAPVEVEPIPESE